MTEPSPDWLVSKALDMVAIVFVGLVAQTLIWAAVHEFSSFTAGNMSHLLADFGRGLAEAVFYGALLTAGLYAIVVGVSRALDDRDVR
ncbi:hypothetical protein [Salarchaeum japonicum]|uniref:hypothetical protein n=1 Tax=Salarchaeum japonicum TaxID=555573 RepID=UPI003C75F08C